MKLEELFEDQLDEISLKNAAAAIAIATSALTPSMISKHEPVKHVQQSKSVKKADSNFKELLSSVISNYKIPSNEAEKIVSLAIKYEKPSFPKAVDILAIIGIESSFNKNAKSKLKKDPAIGLTQVRPKMWGLKPTNLKSNIELQIKTAVDILSEYHRKLGCEEKAVHAYNIGLTALKNGQTNFNYVEKYKNELEKYN
jgi:hypothetical protein